MQIVISPDSSKLNTFNAKHKFTNKNSLNSRSQKHSVFIHMHNRTKSNQKKKPVSVYLQIATKL